MPTAEEKHVDGHIAEYNEKRLTSPDLRLPEVSAKNREYLIACFNSQTNAFSPHQGLLPVDGSVFFGSWNVEGFDWGQSRRNSTWFRCSIQGDYEKADLIGARFVDCQMANIRFLGSNLTDVVFENCTFIRASMSGATFENVKVIRPIFKHYDPIEDDLDQVKFGWKSWLFDWAKLRILSQIPMFSISWSTLLGSLAIMNIIGWGSSNRDKLASIAEPLSMPTTLIELFIAAFFLATAATLYAAYCPPRVKEISETEWTDKQGKPRLQYYSHRFPYRWRERTAIVAIYVFGSLGLILTGKLVAERVGSAYCFTTNWETPEQCEAPQPLQ
jgi:hypothetical protein